jgi:hypothetical protein
MIYCLLYLEAHHPVGFIADGLLLLLLANLLEATESLGSIV